MNSVQLAHGSGGQAMQQLINSLFMEAFANPWLAEQEDQARLDRTTGCRRRSSGVFNRQLCYRSVVLPGWQYRQAGHLRYG